MLVDSLQIRGGRLDASDIRMIGVGGHLGISGRCSDVGSQDIDLT